MASKIFTILLIVVFAGLALYVIRSGIISQSLDSLKFPSFSSSSSTSASESNNGGGTTYISSGNGSGENVTTSEPPQASSTPTSSIPSWEIPTGFTASQLSPDFHDVRIGGVSYGSAYSYYGTISLYAYLPASTTIDITGWEIKSNRGGEYIPKAINVYDPSGLTAPSDIAIKNGDDVYLYSSSAPFNLRLNECIGYIAAENKFTPALPESCPQLDLSEVEGFSSECYNYVESLGSCQVPNLNNANIPYYDTGCYSYIENIGYASCFNQHASDPNFLSNQIWVWTGSNIVDEYHDQVELLDKNGLVVDVYTY